MCSIALHVSCYNAFGCHISIALHVSCYNAFGCHISIALHVSYYNAFGCHINIALHVSYYNAFKCHMHCDFIHLPFRKVSSCILKLLNHIMIKIRVIRTLKN